MQFWPISPSMPASLSLQPAGPAETAMAFAKIADVSTVQCLASRAAMRADRSLAVADERQTPSKSAKAVAWVAQRRCAQQQGCRRTERQRIWDVLGRGSHTVLSNCLARKLAAYYLS